MVDDPEWHDASGLVTGLMKDLAGRGNKCDDKYKVLYDYGVALALGTCLIYQGYRPFA